MDIVDGKASDMVSVRSWNDVDFDELANHMQAIAFDLDNTLASSKRPMVPDMADRFTELTRRTVVAVVTGGRYELVTGQILDVLGERADRSRLYLMPTGGSRCYRWRPQMDRADGGIWECVYAHDLSDEDRREACMSLMRRAQELGLWRSQVWGERIEDRGSQITFSALGQAAPEDAKQAWDPDDEKKRRLVSLVSHDLPHLTVRSGGYTSIDVSLPGMDKSFAMHELSKMIGVEIPRIVFVGDRMAPGGNDYPAAEAGAYAIGVRDPADTMEVLDRLLHRLPMDDRVDRNLEP